ncbi:MAG: formylglycine-generating enzyme family protein, partial [Nitrospira sp.]|nr:formylglycine-generating enzyme family protein [Nitrospira sp.]
EKNGSPYPGLIHFTAKYAPVFFGRDMEVREILDRMRTPEGRFLLISGASGSGKSSLVDAGVLPKIEKSGIVGDRTYTCVRMVPSKGHHPFDALLRPLHLPAERAGVDAYQLVEQLVREPGDLSLRLREIVANGLDTDGLVLFLDQMEELFTVRDLAQSRAFLSALYQAVQDVSLYVIATIRSDFLQYCHEHADLLEVLRGPGHYPLGTIDSISLGEMIAKPAHCAGLTIAESLVRRLVREAGEERGSLPILAFALRQLFDNRDGKALTETAFDQLGGLAGAICSYVTTVEDQIAKSLGTSGWGDEVFPKLFASLVVVSIDGTPTRRWASKQKFNVLLRSVIDILIKERLCTADEGKDHESLISVAHEKLFDGWPRLAAWIEANRRQLFTLRHAEIAAGEWEQHRYDLTYLWPEERLKKLQEILNELGHEEVSDAVRRYAAPQDTLIAQLEDASLAHTKRLKIGQYLAALGDPRSGVGVKNGVPDIAWIDIPEGCVKLSDVNRTFNIKLFRIAKYPVTNAQFEAFLTAQDGYCNEEWWQDIRQSDKASKPSWQEANGPRETVFWGEAVAFCRWLSAKTGMSIRLPNGWEWQQAATGGDPTREYPWPGGWDPSRCNSWESRLNRTTAVGMYPCGATQQGLMDMAGNVWEWCQNTHENPERPEAVRFDNDRGVRRVIRGGSWFYEPGNLRTLDRGRDDADIRYDTIGFRLVQDLGP